MTFIVNNNHTKNYGSFSKALAAFKIGSALA